MLVNKYFAFFIFAFIGCSTNYKIMKTPTEYSYSQKTVSIILDKGYEIKYTGSVENEFGKGNPSDLIAYYFPKLIARQMKNQAVFKDVEFCDNQDIDTYKLLKVDFGIDSILVAIPKNLKKYRGERCDSDVFLVLSRLNLVSITKVYINFSRAPIIPIPKGFSRSLNVNTNFAYIDRKTGEILAYGKLNENVGAGFSIEIDEWIVLVNRVVEQLLMDKSLKKL